MFFTSVYLIISLTVLLHSNPVFDPRVQRSKLVLRTIQIIWYLGVAIRCSVARQLSKNDPKAKINFETLSFILIVVGHLPICYFVLSLQESRENNILLKHPKNIKSQAEAEFLINTMMRLIKGRNKTKNYVKIHGFLGLHAKAYLKLRNENKEAPIIPQTRVILNEDPRQILNRNESTFNSSQGLSSPWQDLMEEKWLKTSKTNQNDFSEELDKQAHNRFLEYLIQECLKKFAKSTSLRLYLALFQHHKMNKKWQPSYLLTQIINTTSSFIDGFTAQRVMIQIEKQLRVEDEACLAEGGLDVTKLVKFTQNFREFVHLLKSSVLRSRDFWEELAIENPDAKKFMSLACSILNLHPVIKKKFEKLLKYDVRNSEVYSLYAGYIQDVIHDEDNNTDIIEKAQQFLRNERILSMSSKALKNSLNDIGGNSTRMCIIEVSGNEESLGEVVNANNSTWDVFGYKPKELIGNNISILMHSYYAEKHDDFMRRNFSRESSSIINRNRIIFAKHSKGYLICCKLLLKVLPDLTKGIRLVGILTESELSDLKMIKELQQIKRKNDRAANPIHLIQIIENTGEIIGISESCHNHFGLKPSLFGSKLCSNPPDAQLLFPGLLEPSNLRKLNSENGLSCVIDTSLLNDNYYFVGNTHDEKGDLVKTNKNGIENSENLSDDDSDGSGSSCLDSDLKESDESSIDGSLDDQDLSLSQSQQMYRRTGIQVWLQTEEKFGEDKIITLSFIENRIRRKTSDRLSEEFEKSILDIGGQRLQNRKVYKKVSKIIPCSQFSSKL